MIAWSGIRWNTWGWWSTCVWDGLALHIGGSMSTSCKGEQSCFPVQPESAFPWGIRARFICMSQLIRCWGTAPNITFIGAFDLYPCWSTLKNRNWGLLREKCLNINSLVVMSWWSFRYKSLCPATWPHWHGPAAEGVERLIKHIGYKPEEYKLGR